MNGPSQWQPRQPNTSTSAAIAFTLLNILMFPVTLIGYIIWIVKGVLMPNRSGVSSTAQGPLTARFGQHEVGLRRDEAAARLMRVLPAVPPVARQMVFGPILLANRLTGYLPRAFRYPFEGEVGEAAEASARQAFLDQVVERALPHVSQFVILGAGFDTRAYRLPPGASVRAFEVDTPKTQAVKRAMLQKAGVDAAHITFVPADFEKEDWLARLVESGFDPSRPTLFLWEGVMMYLDRASVQDTFRKIAGSARGSIVAFDYFTTEPLVSMKPYWRFARVSTKAAGEPLTFGIDSTPPSRERLAEFLRACGLTLEQHQTLGKDTETERAWGGFATAVVR
jgi:methyltransferase (TIGR00027 family)